MEYVIDSAGVQDRKHVIDIFNYYVRNSFAAYPEDEVDYAFYDRLLELTRGYPFLTVRTAEGKTVGFALLRPWHASAAFRRSAEIGYFITPEHAGKGAGARLLARIEEEASKIGVDTILASISSLNEGSVRFHAKHGFEPCGRFAAVGRKFGRDFDVVWVQKRL